MNFEISRDFTGANRVDGFSTRSRKSSWHGRCSRGEQLKCRVKIELSGQARRRLVSENFGGGFLSRSSRRLTLRGNGVAAGRAVEGHHLAGY